MGRGGVGVTVVGRNLIRLGRVNLLIGWLTERTRSYNSSTNISANTRTGPAMNAVPGQILRIVSQHQKQAKVTITYNECGWACD